MFSSIPETHSPLEIKEPGSASYVQWKTSLGGNFENHVFASMSSSFFFFTIIGVGF